MKVGVYVDGFNLYYGGRKQCGDAEGWRWLDVRGLSATLVEEQRGWPEAQIERVVYCSAPIDQGLNPSGYAKQLLYFRRCSSLGASTWSSSASIRQASATVLWRSRRTLAASSWFRRRGR